MFEAGRPTGGWEEPGTWSQWRVGRMAANPCPQRNSSSPGPRLRGLTFQRFPALGDTDGRDSALSAPQGWLGPACRPPRAQGQSAAEAPGRPAAAHVAPRSLLTAVSPFLSQFTF